MRLMTTPILVLVCAVAAVVLFGIFAGIPMWMTRRRPDAAPDNKLPGYLGADWKSLPDQVPAGAGQRSGANPSVSPGMLASLRARGPSA
jgi:hypothetical protein